MYPPRINIRQDLHNTFTDNSVATDEARHNDVTWNRENIEGSITYTHVIRPDVSDISVKGSVSKIWGHRPSYYFVDDEKTNYSNSGEVLSFPHYRRTININSNPEPFLQERSLPIERTIFTMSSII